METLKHKIGGVVITSFNDYLGSYYEATKKFYEYKILDKTVEHLKGGFVIDIGANIGNHSLYWAKKGVKNIVAFEPVKAIYDFYVENMKANKVETTAYNCALGKEDEIVDFYIDNRNMGACRKGVGIDGGVSVQVHKLDSYLFNQKVDLIKIDVEGMELEVLEGGRETIDKNKPIIMIEIKSIDIHNYLSDIGYKPLFREHKTCLYSYNPI